MDIQFEPELESFFLKDVERTGKILGVGTFGSVEEVTMNGAPCAGKKMHDMLMRADKKTMVRKMISECHLMSELKHPNIVQFFGLHSFPDSRFPVIIMEKLDINLDTLLTSFKDIQLHMKIIIMQDVCQGLNYLHTLNPPVIHRDLTPMNVLLTSAMVAKLSDLGNARIIEIGELSRVLSVVPGNILYMPPEAFEYKPKYDISLDMFSFGHLVLYIMLQESPDNFLSQCYPDPKNLNAIIPRTEIQRRQKYMDRVNAMLPNSHPINKILERCLSNVANNRLTAAQVSDILTRKESGDKRFDSEVRRIMSDQYFRHLHNEESPDGNFEESSEIEGSLSVSMLEQIKAGEPMLLDKRENTTQGFFKREKHTQWTKYVFCIEQETFLRYYVDMKKKKSLGEIELYRVSGVKRTSEMSDSMFSFEVHFDRKDSPWHIRACTRDVMNCWMEAIKKKYVLDDSSTAANIPHESPPAYEEVVNANYKPHNPRPRNDYDEVRIQPYPVDRKESVSEETTEYQQFEQYTEEQLEHLAEMLDNIMQKKKGEAACKDEVNITDTGSTSLHTITEELQDNLDSTNSAATDDLKPPPLPPKKRKFAARGDQEESEKQTLTCDVAGPFRDRKKAESRKKLTIKRIMNHDSRLTKTLVEHGDVGAVTPSWTLSSTTGKSDVVEKHTESETLSKDMFLDTSSIEDFKLIEAGDFGKMYIGKLKILGKESVRVVLKTLLFTSEKEKNSLLRELVTLLKMKHPNVVHFYGLINHKHEILVVLEYMSCGSLHSYLRKYNLPIPKLVKFMVDIAMGMHHLSSMGLVHRDLAARNIYVDQNELCKIGDFGQLKELPKDGDAYYTVPEASKIPIRWCSPEYLTERKCSSASDVWSYGILLWEMANPGKLPYENYKHKDIISKIKLGYTLNIPHTYPKEVQDVIRLCWKRNPSERPSFLYICMLLTKVDSKK